MAKFKLKLSRVITSFQSCRSKDPSSLPSDPVPSFLRPSPVNSAAINLHLPAAGTPEPSRPHHSSIKRHVSSALTSIGCGFRSRSTNYISETDHTKSPPPPPTPEFHWEKEDRWHVIAKIYDESAPRQKVYNSYATKFANDAVSLPFQHPTPSTTTKKKKRRHKRKKTTARIRISTSSADSGALFSSEGFDDDDEDIDNNVRETETLMSSSRSFSTDSSSELFNPCNGTGSSRKAKLKKGKRSAARRVLRRSFEWMSSSSSTSSSPARLSRFQWLIPCTVEGKVRESFAVVKKSDDPYEDFRRSMMEMILEKQMFEEKDLEQLLHWFLSLNSRHHHAVILQAFCEIWEAVFCT